MDDFATLMRSFKSDDLGPATTAAEPLPEADVATMFASAVPDREFRERCEKCRGSGVWQSWSGRAMGKCFACDGRGFRAFKTSPEQRKASRERAGKQREQQRTGNLDLFRQSHEAEAAWIDANAVRFEFAKSMREAIERFGSLTERQLDAVRRCVERDTQRTQQRAAEAVSRTTDCDLERIEQAFAKARESGLKRIRVTIGDLVFKPAPEGGKNPGAVYVSDKGEGAYLGKVFGGKLFRSRDCDEATATRIAEVAADPAAAAIAHGKETGRCAICSRELSDPISIERGIGPICADKFGF